MDKVKQRFTLYLKCYIMIYHIIYWKNEHVSNETQLPFSIKREEIHNFLCQMKHRLHNILLKFYASAVAT